MCLLKLCWLPCPWAQWGCAARGDPAAIAGAPARPALRRALALRRRPAAGAHGPGLLRAGLAPAQGSMQRRVSNPWRSVHPSAAGPRSSRSSGRSSTCRCPTPPSAASTRSLGWVWWFWVGFYTGRHEGSDAHTDGGDLAAIVCVRGSDGPPPGCGYSNSVALDPVEYGWCG